MESTDIVALLKKISFFNGLFEQDYTEIAQVFSLKVFQEGEKIITEGSTKNRDAYILLTGSACTHIETSDNNEQQAKINMINSGQIFGEFAMVSDAPRSATVLATETSHVLVLNTPEFFCIVEKNYHLGLIIYKQIATILADRVRHTNAMLKHTIVWGW